MSKKKIFNNNSEDSDENINYINVSKRKILGLDKKLNIIFNSNREINNPTSIKYKFSYEYDYGFIEYKRTLSTYSGKIKKLLRQIYWRMYQSSIYFENCDPKCYYLIGLEDNGFPSNINLEELDESLKIIKKSIENTDIKLEYLYLNNELYKSYILVIKLSISKDKFYFEF